jgi:hypothetical protein
MSPLASSLPEDITTGAREALESFTETESDSGHMDVDMMTATLDVVDQLDAHYINVNVPGPLVGSLRNFVNQVIRADRNDMPSPTAGFLARNQPVAQILKKASGISLSGPNLTVRTLRKGGEPGIIETVNAVLASEYIPSTPVTSRFSKLPLSAPDTAIGYIAASIVKQWEMECPLTEAKEMVVVS